MNNNQTCMVLVILFVFAFNRQNLCSEWIHFAKVVQTLGVQDKQMAECKQPSKQLLQIGSQAE